MEKLTYYDRCPNCGAANIGKDNCTYCNTSMIKERVIKSSTSTTSIDDIETKNRYEDRNLPVEKAITAGVQIFMLLFGGIFFGVGLFIFTIFNLIAFSTPSASMFSVMSLFPLIFVAIGGFVLSKPLKERREYKKHIDKGTAIKGILRSYRPGNYMINDRPVQIMEVKVNHPSLKMLDINTNQTYKKYPVGSEVELIYADEKYFFNNKKK